MRMNRQNLKELVYLSLVVWVVVVVVVLGYQATLYLKFPGLLLLITILYIVGVLVRILVRYVAEIFHSPNPVSTFNCILIVLAVSMLISFIINAENEHILNVIDNFILK